MLRSRVLKNLLNMQTCSKPRANKNKLIFSKQISLQYIFVRVSSDGSEEGKGG